MSVNDESVRLWSEVIIGYLKIILQISLAGAWEK